MSTNVKRYIWKCAAGHTIHAVIVPASELADSPRPPGCRTTGCIASVVKPVIELLTVP